MRHRPFRVADLQEPDLSEVDVHDALAEITGGRGPDACIDAVGLEAHGYGAQFVYDRAKQAMKLELDRPTALRQAIRECRNGGIVSIIGAYVGYDDKFPLGPLMNRSLTIRATGTPGSGS